MRPGGHTLAALPAVLAITMIAAAAGCTGGGAEYGCADIPPCGGNPVGVWKAHGFCQYTPPLSYKVQQPDPPPQAIALAQSPNLVKVPAPPRASGDWCTSLQYVPPNATNPNTPEGGIAQLYQLANTPGAVVGAQVTLSANHDYQVAVELLGTTTAHFAPTCLMQFGANPSCDDLAAQLGTFETQPNYKTHPPPYFACAKAADGGCDCTYSYEGTNADQGTWQIGSDNNLYFFSAQSQFQPVVQTTYCASANQLTLSGSNGQSLFATSGLRTLTLVPGN
jgi:hypothetical protein